jgi:hypothetical protein
MAPPEQTIVVLGDQTDPFTDGIDYIYHQAQYQPWLQSFLADSHAAFKDEMKHWDHELKESVGTFDTFHQLCDRFRYEADDTGIPHGVLVFIMRQALLLQ